MKKTLSMILALLLIACSLPSIITSYAEDSVNLLADASNANGAVTWTDKIDPRSSLVDSKTESVYGGYSWTFGLGYADVVGDKFEYVNIKATGLKAAAMYDFSYIYQRDFVFAIDSIKNANGDSADYTAPVTSGVADKARAHQVSTAFTVPADGDYTIKLKINRDMRTADCAWDTVVLGDLVLTEIKTLNYLENASYSNGDVSWTTSTDVAQKVGNIDSWGVNDNRGNSVNGGYSWSFGLGDANVVGNVYAYVYIKAKGLTANTKYDFSYIYQKDFIIGFDSITDKDGAKVETEGSANDTAITSGDRAHQVGVTFVAPADGDYTITLKTNRDMRPANCQWSHVVLSDLVLIKSTAASKVATEVLVSGNGDATVSNDMTAIGNQVTYTAAPWQDEEFLGWYYGDEKISDSLVYSFAVTEKVSLTARFTSRNLNVLAGKKASDWTGYQWAKINDSTESKNGGKGYLVNKAMHQSIYTKVVLKPNAEYELSFNWKAVQNSVCPAYPFSIKVYSANAVNIEDRSNWKDGSFLPSTGVDLEQGDGYASEDKAKTYQWQSISTGFTTTADTEYNLVIQFRVEGGNNDQAINLSDFVLKEKSTAPPAGDEGVKLSEKDASDWTGYEHAKIENSNESKDGGKGYLVNDAMYQSVYTKLNLKANTEYKLSFNWKAVQNDVCPAFPAAIKVYSASAADIEDRANNWKDGGNFDPQNATDLEQGGGYASEDMAKTYQWQSISTGFTTTADTEYNLVIHFTINGGANHQAVNLSDFVLEEVGGSQEPQTPTLSEKDASDWTGYEWAKIENTDVSRYGGKGYLVRKAMYQNIYTSLTLKPNTKYNLSFEWKSVENEKGPAYPNEIAVTAKNDIDIDNRANWKDSDFQYGIFDLEPSSRLNNSAAALTYDWQNVTVSFNTKDDSEYNLLIHFQADGNGEQEVYVSDFKLEEVGPIGGGDDEVDADNLAATYTNANGHVTWTDNADAHSDKIDRRSDIEGGYSWGFGLASTNFDGGVGPDGTEWGPAYVYIKTDDLEAGRKYEFSYIFQKDFLILFDSINSDAQIVKTDDTELLEGDRAHRITVQFTTTKAGPYTITLKMGKGQNNAGCEWSHTVLSDLKLYDITDRIYGKVSTEAGGTITGFDKTYCTRGDEITLTATPLAGNTFKGWFNENDELVSADAVYTFTAESDFNLTARYLGSNIPNIDWLTQHGMDGTFEDGTMFGWKAEDRDNGDDTSWASFERSTDMAYNGNYSLRFRSRYRTTFFRFTELNRNTNYILTFYVNDPDLLDPQTDGEDEDYNNEALIRWFSLTSGNATIYSEAGSQSAPAIKGGSGWYKVNLFFNTGDYTEVDWNFYYTDKNGAPIEFIYMDDISLVEYTTDTFKNGNFESGVAPWRGELTVDNGAGKGANFYQNISLGAQTLHTVTFKAKGKGVGGASQITTKPFDATTYVSSQSAVNINSDDWKTYSFEVYTGVNPDVSLFFKATEGELLVDDVTVTRAIDRSGAIVEKVDFESERFALHVDSDVFEIYNGTAGDANVHSGTKSLRFNSANAEKGINYILEDAFLSAQIPSMINYKLTFYYKTTKGNSIYLAPEFLPDDGVQTLYTAAGNGWTKVEFLFSKLTNSYMRFIIGNISGKTNADFYIDDITLSIAPPMVIDSNSANKYCEWPLNVLNNQGFEEKITKDNWANLPGTTELRTDKGAAGDNYLRVKAGTHYVLPVKIEAGHTYYFSISTRLGKNSSGYAAVATNPQGTQLYGDIEGNPASKIVVDTSKWNRDSILFSTSESDVIYLVFAADKGYIDVDEVHLYKEQYGRDIDPNDHTKYVPYNYDNPDPSTVVLNGGDPTFSGNEVTEGDGSPETGDNRTAPATVLVISTLAAFALVATTKRTRKNLKGGKA